MRGALGRLSMWVVGGAITLGLGVSGVGWMIGEVMTRSLAGYQAEFAKAETRMAEAEALIVELENKTGGLMYRANDDGARFLLWRKGDEPFKTPEGRWAVKLKGK